MKFVYLDFEYNQTQEAFKNVVCVALEVRAPKRKPYRKSIWLEGDDFAKGKFVKWLEARAQDSVFVAYNAQAEAGAILSLGFDPLKIRWYDLYLEYRMLTNHCHKYAYGKQLTKSGQVKTIRPPKPKYERVEGDDTTSPKPETGLVYACFKMLGVRLDKDHKDQMRDLIIGGGPFKDIDMQHILRYCQEDVTYLPALHRKIVAAIKDMLLPHDRDKLHQHMLTRGEYGALSSIIERNGYPINYEATKNFASSVSTILCELQGEITDLFPDIQPFLPNKTRTKYIQKMKNIRTWVDAQGFNNWMKTPKGDSSLSLDAFARYFPHRHEFPTDNFGAQMVRFLKTKQSLNGFMPAKKGKKSFWDSVGSDHRARPWMGIYGAQSSRSQPSATGFIPLKAAWMRSLIEPPPGRAIVGIDYSQQEFLLAALLSQDDAMIAAYESGDVYLYTGKLAGAIPWDATKQTHGPLRDKFKSTVLGIQYLMGPHGLAKKITQDTGVETSVDEAEDLIALFNDTYHVFDSWRDEMVMQYRIDGYLQLPCGWTMWGDNHNFRSVANCPIQGFGASIMRKAVALATYDNLDVSFTLHDAVYVEYDSNDYSAIDRLAVAMDKAHHYYLKDMANVMSCRMDPSVWSTDYDGRVISTEMFPEVKLYNKYIDERAVNEYRKFRTYFHPQDEIKYLQQV